MRCSPGWIDKNFEALCYFGEGVCDFGVNYHCRHCSWKRRCHDGGSFVIGNQDDHYYEALMDMKCHLIEEHEIDEKRLPLIIPVNNPFPNDF